MMTVSTTASSAGPYACNGSTTEFPVNFPFLENDDLVVYLIDSTGASTTLTIDTDYTVTGAGGSSGTVTTVATYASGNTILIDRVVDLLQETDLENQATYYPEVLEDSLDKLTMIAQQLYSGVSRSIKFPTSDMPITDPVLPSRVDRLGKFLQFDSVTGQPIATSQTIDVADYSGIAFETVAELRLSDPDTLADGQVAVVGGYYAAGDGGGGPLRVWETSGAPYTDNGGSVIIPTAGDGSGAWVFETSENMRAKWFGAVTTGDDQTAIIQTMIDSTIERIIVDDGVVFALNSLVIPEEQRLIIDYRFDDESSYPNGVVGKSGQRMVYTDSGIIYTQNISDNAISHNAPYHPAFLLDGRSDIDSSWVSDGQKFTYIPGSFIINREGRTRAQLTCREFDYEDATLAAIEQNGNKSGIDLSLWRTLYTSTTVTSASWAVPPVKGDVVYTSTGKIFHVHSILAGSITLAHRKGSPAPTDVLIFNGVNASSQLGTTTTTTSSAINRLSVNYVNGAVGVNLPPEKSIDTEFAVGGRMFCIDSPGGIYGASKATIGIVDSLETPAKGAYYAIDATNDLVTLYQYSGTKIGALGSGTFTVTVKDAPTGNSVQPTQQCNYIISNGVVFFTIFLLNVNTAGMTGTNQIHVVGLPFTAKNITGGYICNAACVSVTSTTGSIFAEVVPNTAYLTLNNNTTAGRTPLLISGISSGAGDFTITGSYIQA